MSTFSMCRGIWFRVNLTLNRHPRWPMALKAAAAATCAWLAVLPFSGLADDYPYYAPLGAVIAVSGTVAQSLRVSVQTVIAIVIGASLTVATSQTPLPSLLILTLVVAIGIVIAGIPYLGPSGQWVPVAALFALVIGNSDRVGFVLAYIGLTSLGAAIGIAFNAAIPPLPLQSAAGALGALREALAGQLDDLAEGLGRDEPPTRDEWERNQRDISRAVDDMQRTVSEASKARRANWRARRWEVISSRQLVYARALQRLSLTVEDLTLLVVDGEHRQAEQTLVLGSQLRGPCATALSHTAKLLRETDEYDPADTDIRRAADTAVRQFAASIVELHHETGSDIFAAGSIVTSLRQVIATGRRSVTPEA